MHIIINVWCFAGHRFEDVPGVRRHLVRKGMKSQVVHISKDHKEPSTRIRKLDRTPHEVTHLHLCARSSCIQKQKTINKSLTVVYYVWLRKLTWKYLLCTSIRHSPLNDVLGQNRQLILWPAELLTQNLVLLMHLDTRIKSSSPHSCSPPEQNEEDFRGQDLIKNEWTSFLSHNQE